MAHHDARDIFVTGLKNAHAMENQALAIMKPQADRIQNYPQVEARLRDHILETEGQIERLDRILDDMGEDRSALKDTALSMGGTMAAMGHTLAPDEIVKNSFADFAFENYEIAAYKSLLCLAEEAGMRSAIGPLRQNLEEEQAMAEWLDSNIEAVTLQYAGLRTAGEEAKR